MKKIFENQEDAVRVLSNSAMKKVLGGNQPEGRAGDLVCMVQCETPNGPIGFKVRSCDETPPPICGGRFTGCICDY